MLRENDVPEGAVWKRVVVEGGRLGAQAASSKEVAERWANNRSLHPGVRVVVGPERFRQQQGAEHLFRSRCTGVAAT